MRAMLIFTDSGPRSVDDRDVLQVWRGGSDGRYTHCTLALVGGTEVSGAVLNRGTRRASIAARRRRASADGSDLFPFDMRQCSIAQNLISLPKGTKTKKLWRYRFLAQKTDFGIPSIRELLDREGSDKAKWYRGLYDVLLQPHRQTIRCVVEIGIGTLLPEAVSSMVGYAAEHYRPGGSLRAWRNFLPQAEVYGLDVAPDTQFSNEPRIHTYLCDLTDADEATEILRQISHQPDLIVDDGLHDVTAQIKTLKNFLPALRDGGLYVVEDVGPDDVQTLLDELDVFQPGCHYFVDRSWGTRVAVVIRKPSRNGNRA
jgi:hypothetical protein